MLIMNNHVQFRIDTFINAKTLIGSPFKILFRKKFDKILVCEFKPNEMLAIAHTTYFHAAVTKLVKLFLTQIGQKNHIV